VAGHGWRADLPRKLLWVDCTAAALAGAAVLAFSGWLSRLYALPRDLLLLIGAVNLLYGCYSFSLALRPRRPKPLLNVLVFANLAWAAVCLVLAAVFWQPATPFGLAQLIGEAVFVGGLAGLEWRNRDQLLTAA
jgi:hypothetical protein